MKTNQPLTSEEPTKDEIDLIGVLDVLVAYRWFIVKAILVCLTIGTLFAYLYPPLYTADALIQVEDSSDMAAAAAQSLLGDVSSLFDYKATAAAEQQIMESRLVVTSVVDELHGYIVAKPKRFPVIGDFISRFNDTITQPGVFGLGGFAWGTESIEVEQFDVPQRLESDHFTLTVLSGGQYRLSGWDLDAPMIGKIGVTQVTRTGYGPITLHVKSANALAGTKFELVRNSRLETIETMQKGLDIEEKIKQSDVLVATLKGHDPKLVHDEMLAVGRYYVKQNVERKTQDAAQSLDFLNAQLPMMKRQLELSEDRYTSLRNREGTVDLPEEAKIALQQSADAKTRLLELKQKRDELAARYTPTHPEVVALNAQMATLALQQKSFDQEIKRLPDLQQDAARLMLDVKVNTDLYMAVMNNIQQLELVRAGKTGSVRIVDTPVVPEDVTFPNRPVTICAGALIGLLIGIGFAFAHDFLFAGIDEPDEIEKEIGLSVYATIPASPYQQRIERLIAKRAPGDRLLAEAHPREPAIESLRSLRTALQFAMVNARNNLILLSGPIPGVGKSFVSANLAAMLASSGKRILVIDGDLRKGYLHEYFRRSRERGLTDVVSDGVQLKDAIHQNVAPNLDFLSTGVLPPNAAELLMHARIEEILETCSRDYDLVLIDSPPVLVVTDAVILARHCATVMLVVRAGQTRIAELSEAVKRFAHNGVNVTGALLNGVDPRSGRQAYGRKHGGYRYVQYTYEDARPSFSARLRQMFTSGRGH
ncbi:polysaccharide biosynthesis tyrosine autokinase [Paraburkholderia jirisanensis]